MAEKDIVFAGAAPIEAGTPWGTLALTVKKALEPHGYSVRIEVASWGNNNPKFVSDGRADLGATQYPAVQDALEGTGGFADDGPRSNLRLIATINQPAWIGVAVRAESEIYDLGQIAAKQMPVRLKAGPDRAVAAILDYYRISKRQVVEWGGQVIGGDENPAASTLDDPGARWAGRDWNAIAPWVAKGQFDVIVDPIYAACTPEHKHWLEATMLHDLRFLPLPADLIESIVQKNNAEAPGMIPHRLMRGVNEDIPSVQRFPQVIYTRAEADTTFIYEVAKVLDESRHLFRETHMPYSYDPGTVARPRPVPLHSGAERYYRDAGHLR